MASSDPFSLLPASLEYGFKFAARFQCETLALMSRRMRAYADLPKVIAACHSPEDFVTEQVRFWQTAQRQYAESLQSVMPAAGYPLLAAGLAGSARTPRDYIVLSDHQVPAPRDEVPAPQPGPTVEEPRLRRSA